MKIRVFIKYEVGLPRPATTVAGSPEVFSSFVFMNTSPEATNVPT